MFTDDKKMITCLVCKESKSEGYFVELKFGGLAICSDCNRTPEAEKLKEDARKRMIEDFKRQEAYDAEKEEKIKNQIYDGQYDWM